MPSPGEPAKRVVDDPIMLEALQQPFQTCGFFESGFLPNLQPQLWIEACLQQAYGDLGLQLSLGARKGCVNRQ